MGDLSWRELFARHIGRLYPVGLGSRLDHAAFEMKQISAIHFVYSSNQGTTGDLRRRGSSEAKWLSTTMDR